MGSPTEHEQFKNMPVHFRRGGLVGGVPIYIYIYIYMYVHIHLYIYTHTHIHTHMHTYMYTHIWMCGYKYTYIYIYISPARTSLPVLLSSWSGLSTHPTRSLACAGPCALRRKARNSLRMPGVEPGSQAWMACMMPLHYMRH